MASANITRSFASDNNAGVHPEVLEAITRANQGHVVAYGDDPYTRSAIAKFQEHFGDDIEVFFTFNGTGANVLGLQELNRSYHAVLCSDYAHIYTDECGAPEKHTGCKLIPLPHQDGKITRKEFVEKQSAFILRFDRNSDCRVTGDELRAATAPKGPQGPAERPRDRFH